ncbi:MAG TPA: hypothetical protein VM581_01945 [Magnetospirillaceae bacterium]|nr:hypothetical protein [Magnetospirillaceae bacterium]
MKKSTPKPNPNKKLRIILVATFIIGLFGAWLSGPLFSGSFYAGNRSETTRTIQSLIDSIQLSGQVQSGVYDAECNTNGSVGLQTRVSCNAFGYKIAASKDVFNDLKALEKEITAQGFQRYPLINQNQEDFDAILTGEKEGLMRYKKLADARLLIDLTFYKKGETNSDLVIKDLIKKGKISGTKGEDEYFYGIFISANYYSCSDVMFAPCLLRP